MAGAGVSSTRTKAPLASPVRGEWAPHRDPTVPLSPYLRDRLLATLDTMTDERAFQVLDYVEFLDSKYARREPPTGAAGLIYKLQETVEDGLRAGKVSASTVAETLGFMQKAVNVVSGVAAAGQSVASDLAGVASRAAQEVSKAANGAARPAASPTTATVSPATTPAPVADAAWGTGGSPAATANVPGAPAGTTGAPPAGDAASTTGTPGTATAAPIEGAPPQTGTRNWWER
jgi:hypothetical protein